MKDEFKDFEMGYKVYALQEEFRGEYPNEYYTTDSIEVPSPLFKTEYAALLFVKGLIIENENLFGVYRGKSSMTYEIKKVMRRS